jgi:tetratricopeptide (TPR) repeat protein
MFISALVTNALVGWARKLEIRGCTKTALRCYDICLMLNVKCFLAQYHRSFILWDRGDSESAIRGFSMVVASDIDPVFKADAYVRLAHLYDAKGAVDRAIESLRIAVQTAELEPDPFERDRVVSDAYSVWGYLEFKREALPDAERLLRLSLRYSPENAKANACMALVLTESDTLDEAVVHAEAALAAGLDEPAWWSALQGVFESANLPERASYCAEAAQRSVRRSQS